MAEELGGALERLRESASHHPWSDPSALSVLQLMVESVKEMTGFQVAVLSVVLEDDLVTVAYSGPEQFRDELMVTDPVGVLDPLLEQAETWGRFRFVAAEAFTGEFAGTWVETVTDTLDVPDAWHPKDVLLGVLNDDQGVLCGILSVDMPTSLRRPDLAARELLERYATQTERALIIAFERESMMQRIAHAEGARRLIRSAAMPAQASLEAVLSHTHAPLVEGFAASGSWIQMLGPGEIRRGYARSRDGLVVELSQRLIDLAHRLAPILWRDQSVLVLGNDGVAEPAHSSVDPLLVAELQLELPRLGLASALVVPLGMGETCLGFLALTRRAQDPPWSTVETNSLLQIGHDLGAALVTATSLEREREAVSELQQLDEYRTHLIQTLSHEMRTPLAVISGNLEMLLDVELDDSAAQFRNAMARGTARMKRVVDDLLLLAAISDPQHPLVRGPVVVAEVIDEVVALVASTARAKGLTLRVTPPDRDLVVSGHAAEIDRLLSNLVSNAVKYTRPGGSVVVSAVRQGHNFVLKVADDGIGISPSDQTGLFTAFFRTTNPVALQEQGTGLGLSIVAHIAHRHGGRVEVDSQLGTGTTFVVTLPIS